MSVRRLVHQQAFPTCNVRHAHIFGPSQVKLLLPKFHRADSALRSQAAGGVGVCASVAPPAFGCRLGSVHDIFRSRVIFLVPIFCWKAEGDVSPGFGAGVAGLGFVLPRGPGSGKGAVAHKGSPPLLSGVELGGWSRGAWLLAPWARWRRRRVGGVGGRWAIDDLGPDAAGVL